MNYFSNNMVFFRNLFNTIPVIILIINSKGEIVEINDAAKKFIGEYGGSIEYKQKFGGDVFHCIHCKDDPRGCAFGPACNSCAVRINSLEALFKYIKAHKDGKPYDVAILDLTVPGGMGGEDTIKQLVKIDPDVLVNHYLFNRPII